MPPIIYAHRKEYPINLGEIECGRPFFMLNYDGLFIKVQSCSSLEYMKNGKPCPFNDDGEYVPIVNVSTGMLAHMTKEKSCRVY